MASPAKRALRALEELDQWLAKSVDRTEPTISASAADSPSQFARNVTFSLPEGKIQRQLMQDVTIHAEDPYLPTKPALHLSKDFSNYGLLRSNSPSIIGSISVANSAVYDLSQKETPSDDATSISPVSLRIQSPSSSGESNETSLSRNIANAVTSGSDPATLSAAHSDVEHPRLHSTESTPNEPPTSLRLSSILTSQLFSNTQPVLTPLTPSSLNEETAGFLTESQSLHTSQNLPFSLGEDCLPIGEFAPPQTSSPGTLGVPSVKTGAAAATTQNAISNTQFSLAKAGIPPPSEPKSVHTSVTHTTTSPPSTTPLSATALLASVRATPPAVPGTSPNRSPPPPPEPIFHQSRAAFATSPLAASPASGAPPTSPTSPTWNQHPPSSPAPGVSPLFGVPAAPLSPGYTPSQTLVQELLQARQGRPEALYREAEKLYREKTELQEEVKVLGHVLRQVKEEYRRRIEAVQELLKETEARAEAAEIENRTLEGQVKELGNQLAKLHTSMAYSTPIQDGSIEAFPSNPVATTATGTLSSPFRGSPTRNVTKSPAQSLVSHLQLSDLERQLQEMRTLVATQAKIIVAFDAANTAGLAVPGVFQGTAVAATVTRASAVSTEALHETLARTEELMARQGWNKKYLHFSNAVLSPQRSKTEVRDTVRDPVRDPRGEEDPLPLPQSPALRNSRFLREFEREIGEITGVRTSSVQGGLRAYGENIEKEKEEEEENALLSPLRHLRQGQDAYRARRKSESERDSDRDASYERNREHDRDKNSYSAQHSSRMHSERNQDSHQPHPRVSNPRDLIQRRLGLRRSSVSEDASVPGSAPGTPPGTHASTSHSRSSSTEAGRESSIPRGAGFSHTFLRPPRTRTKSSTGGNGYSYATATSARLSGTGVARTKNYLKETASSRASRQPPTNSETAHEPAVPFSRTLRSAVPPAKQSPRKRSAQSVGPKVRNSVGEDVAAAREQDSFVEEPVTKMAHPSHTFAHRRGSGHIDKADNTTDEEAVSSDFLPRLPQEAKEKHTVSGPILSTLEKIMASHSPVKTTATATVSSSATATPGGAIPLNSLLSSQNPYLTPSFTSQTSRELPRSSLANKFGLFKDNWNT